MARLAERLPQSFASQVLDTVLEMFSIHSMAAATLSDLPAIAESTWHGAALACAEMARRGLVGSDQLPHLINWMSKALYFDLRKGSHSIGSNVRDAAAYVLWSLARTQDVGSLRPHADNLARQLVTVALFDREIHIRRAASAAFQEHVGRTVSIFLYFPIGERLNADHSPTNRAYSLMESTCSRRLISTLSAGGEMHSWSPHRKWQSWSSPSRVTYPE